MSGSRRIPIEDALQMLRRVLWLSHGHNMLYGDDGEMQCGRCGLDFKRDPVQVIEQRLLRPQGKPLIEVLTDA